MSSTSAVPGGKSKFRGSQIPGNVEYSLSPMLQASVEMSPLPTPLLSDAEATIRASRESDWGDILFRRGEYRDAMARYAECLRLRPRDANYHYKFACAAWKGEELTQVEEHLLETAYFEAAHPAVQEALALWFLGRGQIEQALEHSALALTLVPGNVDYIITRAEVLGADRQDAAAWKLIAPLIASHRPTLWLARCYANISDKIGHETQALHYLERTINNAGLPPGDQARLRYIAARLLDQQGRYDAAFKQARLANETVRRPFDVASNTADIYSRIGYYSQRRMRSLPRATHGSRRPVFIVGMPRSGTSLVEQILASHSQIFGAGELSRISQIIRSAAGSNWAEGTSFPDCYDFLTLRRANELAGEYLAHIDSLNDSATYVTDKMPHNYLYLGTIELLFPDCRVIHCRRDPRDTCLSCYFTDFATQNEFSFDLGHLASYYRDYERLMEHWGHVSSLETLHVDYEQLVADPSGQMERMVNFLELPWDDRCRNFHQNNRACSTASRNQVRKPIFSRSVGRWKNYEKHIGPLRSLLGEK